MAIDLSSAETSGDDAQNNDEVHTPAGVVSDDRERWLQRCGFADPWKADFALNPLTRRIEVDRPADSAAAVVDCTPLAVFLAIPDPPFRPVVSLGDDALWSWISNVNHRRYEPDRGGLFLRGDARMSNAGAMLEERRRLDSPGVSSSVTVGAMGVVQMALGRQVCAVARDRVYFLLAPLVGLVWQFAGFVVDFYQTFGQQSPFSLVVNLRGTEGALLTGFAEGWREPFDGWEVRTCSEPAIQIRRDALASDLKPEAIAAIARDIATELDLFWGHRPPRCYRPTDGAFAFGQRAR